MSENKDIRTLQDKVINDKINKTAIVLIERKVKHPLYDKITRLSTRVHAYDEDNQHGISGVVIAAESRPLSKTKSWVVKELVEKARTV